MMCMTANGFVKGAVFRGGQWVDPNAQSGPIRTPEDQKIFNDKNASAATQAGDLANAKTLLGSARDLSDQLSKNLNERYGSSERRRNAKPNRLLLGVSEEE